MKSAALLLFVLSLSGCSAPEPPAQPAPRAAEILDPVLKERAEKDAAFKQPDSPLSPGDRAKFQGLAYYPVNPKLKFQVRLQRYPAPSPVRLGTNTGEMRGGLRYGYFDFEVEGRPCRLQVYRMDENTGPRLFVPFRDATSGSETYEAGRYLEFDENTSGNYELDFNRAYNPYCAYNSRYSCPVPPAENTLAVPIRAGEKQFMPAQDKYF